MIKDRNLLKIFWLKVAKGILICFCIPVFPIFVWYSWQFLAAVCLTVILVDMVAISAVLICFIQFFMLLAALFDASLWSAMGGMWNWLWSWSGNDTVFILSLFGKCILPYLSSGILFTLLFELLKRVNSKLKFVQEKYRVGELVK